MLRSVLMIVVLVSFFNCKEKEKEPIKKVSAEAVVSKAIEVAGGAEFEQSEINFDFRDTHYKAVRNNGKFQLERQFKDSLAEIRDVLSNSGFERFENDMKVKVIDSMVPNYSASVNSVHYFSVLPYGLNGEAVHKELLEDVSIKEKSYYKIRVTFSENGGGEDFEDVFVYWIDKTAYTVDYLAYSYNETEGLGLRFREAYNARTVNGLRFVDYNNYKPKTTNVNLEDLDDLFVENKLELLSKIELKNIQVKILN